MCPSTRQKLVYQTSPVGVMHPKPGLHVQIGWHTSLLVFIPESSKNPSSWRAAGGLAYQREPFCRRLARILSLQSADGLETRWGKVYQHGLLNKTCKYLAPLHICPCQNIPVLGRGRQPLANCVSAIAAMAAKTSSYGNASNIAEIS